MARTLASTSSATSRLVASSAAKRTSKVGSLVSRRIDIGDLAGVAGGEARRPGRPEVGQLHLEHLDCKPDRAAAGEIENDVARGSILGFEADREQLEHLATGGAVDPDGLNFLHEG